MNLSPRGEEEGRSGFLHGTDSLPALNQLPQRLPSAALSPMINPQAVGGCLFVPFTSSPHYVTLENRP